MNNGIEISVVIPAYNVEKYIGNMIQAVLNQSFTNFELIIVDDCSKDNTVGVIQTFKDDRIVLKRRQENSGVCFVPREDGVLSAKGKWIVYLDADDYIECDYLQELYDRVIEYNLDLCSPHMIRVDNEMHLLGGGGTPREDFEFDRIYSNEEAFNLTVPDWRIGMNGAIVKREIFIAALEQWEGDKYLYRSDEILSRVLLLNAKRYMSSRTKYYYRLNPDSVTSNFKMRNFEWMKLNDYFFDLTGRRFGKDSEEYIKIKIYDFYSYYYTFNMFFRSVNKDDINSGLDQLKKWHRRIDWPTVIPRCKGFKEKVRVLLCRSFRLSRFVFVCKYKSYDR